jgi:hypothetical protein
MRDGHTRPKCSGQIREKLDPVGSCLDLSTACIVCSACLATLLPEKGDATYILISHAHGKVPSSFVSRRISWKAHRAKRIRLNSRH